MSKGDGRSHQVTKGALAALCIALLGTVALAEPGSGSADREARIDRADVQDRAARDSARDADRAARDAERALSRSGQDAARAEADQQRDVARADAQIAEQLARAQEDAADQAARAARDAARAAEEAAEEAAEAAEEAAEEAARAARDGGDDHGAANLQRLVAEENPEQDAQGFPVRRGEIVALDLPRAVLERAQARGFRVIDLTSLGADVGQLTRLAVPAHLSSAEALAQLHADHPAGVFDYAHYFGSQFETAGRPLTRTAAAARPQRPRGMTRFTVGMIDSGVHLPQTAGSTRVVARSFGGSTGVGEHGTAVASILARNGAREILAANVFRGSRDASFADADGVARALGWLISERVPVINLSFAGPRNTVVDALLLRAAANGQIVVAAVGNGGPTAPPAYPAASAGVIAVTATDVRNSVYRYAIRGGHVHFAARGVAVPAFLSDGSSALFSGTSFASPFVAAVIAQCIERVGRRSAQACVTALDRQARDLGAPGRDDVYGFGLVG